MSATAIDHPQGPPTVPPPGRRVPLPPGLGGWMAFVGIMNILGGILAILSCFGLITGVLTVIAGIAIMSARSALETVTTVDAALRPFFDKLKLFVQMLGWGYLVGIIFALLVALFYGAVIFAAVVAGLAEA
jgi:hypothetical protein